MTDNMLVSLVFGLIALFQLIAILTLMRANQHLKAELRAAVSGGERVDLRQRWLDVQVRTWNDYETHWLAQQEARCRSAAAAKPIRWIVVQPDSLQLTGENLMLSLKTAQHALVKIDPKDDRNNIVSIDGKVTFQSTDTSVFTAVPSDDGFSCDCIATPGGEGRVAQLTAVFDADRGAGVENVATSLDVVVDFRQATHGDFTVGEPVDVTPTAPDAPATSDGPTAAVDGVATTADPSGTSSGEVATDTTTGDPAADTTTAA